MTIESPRMTELISVETALGHLKAVRPPPGTETIPITDALNRVTAAPVHAKVSRPSAPVSAMDGYAVRLADIKHAGARLHVIGEAPAGRPCNATVHTGEAVRIFTGSEIPSGADTVVIQENVDRLNDEIVVRDAYHTVQHVRLAGRDFGVDDLILPKGSLINAGGVSLLAASNHECVSVYRKLRVGILANGDELKPPGSELAPGEIINSNPQGLAALIAQWGGEAVDLGIAKDSINAIQEKIRAAEQIDIFLPVGGASVGDHDHMKSAFQGLGFESVFSKIAVKPGKPTWLSKRHQQLALGLPGNPASAFVCAHLFLRPLMETTMPNRFVAGVLTKPLSANGKRETYLRARLGISDSGVVEVSPVDDQDSSLITPFRDSDVLIQRLADAPALNAGDIVKSLLIRDFLRGGSPG